MPITNDNEMQAAAEQAGFLLQEIQDYLRSKDLHHTEQPRAKVRFPRGFIRPAGEQRKRLPFMADNALRTNISYTLILCDAVLWLRLRTDIWGTPNEMLTKLYVFLVGTMVESITKEYLEGVCGKNFKRRSEYLASNGVIDAALQEDLDWLWDTRNRMHLFQLEEPEYENEYDAQCHRRAVRAFRQLLAALSAHGRPSAA
jgi:hypothetical protein